MKRYCAADIYIQTKIAAAGLRNRAKQTRITGSVNKISKRYTIMYSRMFRETHTYIAEFLAKRILKTIGVCQTCHPESVETGQHSER